MKSDRCLTHYKFWQQHISLHMFLWNNGSKELWEYVGRWECKHIVFGSDNSVSCPFTGVILVKTCPVCDQLSLPHLLWHVIRYGQLPFCSKSPSPTSTALASLVRKHTASWSVCSRVDPLSGCTEMIEQSLVLWRIFRGLIQQAISKRLDGLNIHYVENMRTSEENRRGTANRSKQGQIIRLPNGPWQNCWGSRSCTSGGRVQGFIGDPDK